MFWAFFLELGFAVLSILYLSFCRICRLTNGLQGLDGEISSRFVFHCFVSAVNLFCLCFRHTCITMGIYILHVDSSVSEPLSEAVNTE